MSARHAIPFFALALGFALASCSQDVKITAPRYALIYGVGAYQASPLGALPANDARGLATTLASFGWDASHTTEREDAAVTKAQIQADISSLGGISPDSTLLVYFSGHGTTVDETWGPAYYPKFSGSYIVPYDAVTPSGLDSTSILNLVSPAELYNWLSQAGTKNIIVVLDCCDSGGFVPLGSALDPIPQNYGPNDGGTTPGLFSVAFANFGTLLRDNAAASGSPAPIVISAAGSIESSYNGPAAMNHGVFTYFFLESATNGDADGDGFVTTTEAYTYTASQIDSYWNSQYSNTRDPNTGQFMDFYPHISGGVRDLVLFSK